MLYQLSHVRAHLGAFRTVADPAARANSERPLQPHQAAGRHASMPVEIRLGYRRNMTVPAPPLSYDAAPYETDIAPAAALIADPTRAAILRALVPDRPLAAGELARLAGVSAATASFHLAKLLEGRMIMVASQGRHRYYRLAGHEVAAALEALGLISPVLPVRTLRQSREATALAEARTCYDHLAGRAGVELLAAMLRRDLLAREKSKSSSRTGSGDSAVTRFEVTGAGARTFGSFGINVTEIRRSRRNFAGECIDWTQRRGHLNGALAAAITARLFEVGWIEHGQRHRSVRITAAGAEGLAATFGLDLK
jgi:DNA-binding transcriptional ArsR family regulator